MPPACLDRRATSLVAVVDGVEVVLGRVEQVAARHLRVGGARVEQRGRDGRYSSDEISS
jgi:hypothetical protein